MEPIFRRLYQLESGLSEVQRLLTIAPLHAGRAKVTPIVSGAILATRPYIQLMPETGLSDDLHVITNGSDGKIIVVAVASDGTSINLRPYTEAGGNIDLRGSGGGRLLGDPHDSVMLIFRESTGHWEEVAPRWLDGLVGVNTAGAADGYVLTYDAAGAVWIAAAPTGGGGGGAVDSVNGQVGVVVLDADDIDPSATRLWFTAAEQSKLAGIEAGAEINDVSSVNGQVGVVVLDADDIDPSATRVWFTPGEQTKLAGIEAGADATDEGNVAAAIVGSATDDTIADADLFARTSGGTLVKSAWSVIKSTLKSYFDTLYNLYVHPNHTGEVTSTGDGATVIANNTVTLAKMQDIATGNLLGRATAGTGDIELITLTAFARTLIDDIDAAAGRATLGLGTIATEGESAYALLAGRAGGQNLKGGTASGDDLILDSTNHATKGNVVLQPNGGQVLVGTDNQTATVDVGFAMEKEGNFNSLILICYRTSASGARNSFSAFAASGSKAVPSPLTSGQTAFRLSSFAYDGSVFAQMGIVDFIADGGHSAGSTPGGIQLKTTPIGSTTPVTAMTIHQNQVIGVNIQNPGATHLGVQAGTSSNDAAVGGVLYSQPLSAGNTLGGEDDLLVYSLPADTLSANGMMLDIWAVFTPVNNANAKTFRIRFGSTVLINNSQPTGGSGSPLVFHLVCMRLGATSQRWIIDSGSSRSISTSAETLSGPISIRFTGEGVATNDIVLNQVMIEWKDANT